MADPYSQARDPSQPNSNQEQRSYDYYQSSRYASSYQPSQRTASASDTQPPLPAQTPNYICLYSGCESQAYSRHADLQRHVEVIHKTGSVAKVDCTQAGCHRSGAYGFTRKDKMVEHLREVHPVDVQKRQQGRRQMDDRPINTDSIGRPGL
ncbi:hypothetical protein LTR78_004075 [Recurvomyces mirabilis]|uniref:C2H2-type domain-containing protein n=1 Tax=Recurvomyces mirabilis TaxID=574656 RepID=A0AAE1C2Q9_9PEZI|nr:hypothetical protein LTR78_004075 [Recurvomyces mirabilis]KAK5153753.1 hypothetical protein LTS14_007447 [Recurvomyces mirabilis]